MTNKHNKFQLLNGAREGKIRQESEQREYMTEIERINHRYLNQFFQCIQGWYQSIGDLFLQKVATQLSQLHPKGFKINKAKAGIYYEQTNSLMQQLQSLSKDRSSREDYQHWLNNVKDFITSMLIIYPWAKFYSSLSDEMQKISKNIPYNGLGIPDSIVQYRKECLRQYEKRSNELFLKLREKLKLAFQDPKAYFINILAVKFAIKIHQPKSALRNRQGQYSAANSSVMFRSSQKESAEATGKRPIYRN